MVIRTTDGGAIEVALIRTRNLKGADVWTLPKGAPDDGEDAEATALREVREETGLEAEIVEPLGAKTYWFAWPPERVRYRKTVHLYLMRVTGGDPALHDAEVEEVRFFPIAEAERRVSYRTDKQILRQAAERVRAG
ncbi:MAG: NUDIX hydrolase [Candidatus Binatia bacterium]